MRQHLPLLPQGPFLLPLPEETRGSEILAKAQGSPGPLGGEPGREDPRPQDDGQTEAGVEAGREGLAGGEIALESEVASWELI